MITAAGIDVLVHSIITYYSVTLKVGCIIRNIPCLFRRAVPKCNSLLKENQMPEETSKDCQERVKFE